MLDGTEIRWLTCCRILNFFGSWSICTVGRCPINFAEFGWMWADNVSIDQWSSIGSPWAASSPPAFYLWPGTMCFGLVGTCIPGLVYSTMYFNLCQNGNDILFYFVFLLLFWMKQHSVLNITALVHEPDQILVPLKGGKPSNIFWNGTCP